MRKYGPVYLVELGLNLALSFIFVDNTFIINKPTSVNTSVYNGGNAVSAFPDFANFKD